MTNVANISGLCFDIAGAALVALSIALTNSKFLATQSGTYWGGNKVLLEALLAQREDARFGLVFLLVGFALQLAAALGLNVAFEFWPVFVFVGLAGLIAYTVRRRHVTSKGYVDRVFNALSTSSG